MSGSNTLLKIGVIGGVGAYFFWPQVSKALGIGTATAPTPTAPATQPVSYVTTPTAPLPALPAASYTPAPAPASVTPTPAPAPAPPPVFTTPAAPAFGRAADKLSVTSQIPFTEDVLIAASYDSSAAAIIATDNRAQLNWDQWVYYRAKSGKPQITADGFDPNNRAATMSPVEFQRRVQALGLAGLPGGYRRR